MYSWDESDPWTNCPNDCGQNEGDNTRTRNVVCKGDDDSIGIDSQCDGSKPDTEQNCPSTEDCGIYVFICWILISIHCVIK